jgi:hypothetical protein
MTYNVVLYEQAQEDLARLALSEPKAFAKVQRFIEELKSLYLSSLPMATITTNNQ